MHVSDNWVYVIFAKDQNDFQRADQELVNHFGMPKNYDSHLKVFANDKMYVSALIKKAKKRVEENTKYIHRIKFVYTPASLKDGLHETAEHKELMDFNDTHFVRDVDFTVVNISEYIKTPEELAEEERKKVKDMEDWFVSRMRTIADV